MAVATPPQQYDDVADVYDRLVRPRYEPIAALAVDRVTRLLSASQLAAARVVELSTGTGALTHQLAPLVASYVATDVSEPMMQLGRDCPAPACRRVTWRCADAEDTGLPSSSADVVASSLGPVQDSERALSETRRVLRRGGTLVATTWGDSYRELALLQQVRARLGLPQRTVTGAEELRSRVRRAGFGAVSVEEVRLPVVHPSVAAYLAYRGAFGRMPEAGVDPVALREAMARCAQEYLDRSGRVHLDWHLLVLSARGC